MIALCSNHAAKADQGYYPDDYFLRLKREGVGRSEAVQGEFDYLRRDLLAVVGTNAYHNVRTILEIDGERTIFFNRDPDGYLLLNFRLEGVDGRPRAWMEDNVWLVPPGAEYVDCPPRGRHLEVKFENGDRFRLEYSDIATAEGFVARFPKFARLANDLAFPLTVAEFWEKSAGADVELGRGSTRVMRGMISDSAISNARVGISLERRPPSAMSLFSAEMQATIADALATFNAAGRPEGAA